MRPTVMEIDIQKFNSNIDKIKKYVGNKILMPVIKANGYGTHINKSLETINNFNIVAVAIVDEAIELRNLGYEKEIFILNQPSVEEIENIINYNITVGISDEIFLQEIIKINKTIKVHLEMETGMNRTGIKIENLKSFINKIKNNKNIIVEGFYTHLSSADYDEEYTKKQLKIFEEASEIIKSNFDTIKYIHSSASNGLINYNDKISNTVRPGIIMYGYECFTNSKERIAVEPICTLKTKITFIKDVDKDTSISYSRKFITKKHMRIATIPIGYADGLKRQLSNKGIVVVNNKKAPILGSICMDSCMIDVTNIENVKIGTEVYIWDNNTRTLEDIANECDTINYEILSTISSRVPRVLKDNKNITI